MRRLCTFALLAFLGVLTQPRSPAADWAPKTAPLMTRWAKDVDPAKPHPEYPRPTMVRPDWQNLNGLWDYAIRPKDEGKPEKWDGKILVPFPVESA
ncbi:MAG TPA: beta-galactosidase, partial [Gemmataceae bacterium]|nr:beta-galactosidase [Gemmataceae bacterium]